MRRNWHLTLKHAEPHNTGLRGRRVLRHHLRSKTLFSEDEISCHRCKDTGLVSDGSKTGHWASPASPPIFFRTHHTASLCQWECEQKGNGEKEHWGPGEVRVTDTRVLCGTTASMKDKLHPVLPLSYQRSKSSSDYE